MKPSAIVSIVFALLLALITVISFEVLATEEFIVEYELDNGYYLLVILGCFLTVMSSINYLTNRARRKIDLLVGYFMSGAIFTALLFVPASIFVGLLWVIGAAITSIISGIICIVTDYQYSK